MSEEQEIELKTEEVNELLTAVPSWMVRWGITAIFLIMAMALSLSLIIRYPDSLSATTTITTINPPATLIAKTGGKISEIFVVNGQTVEENEVLLVMESNANYNSILKIDSLVNILQSNSLPTNPLSFGEGWSEAGEITPAFLSFLKSYSDFTLQLEMNPQEREISILEKQLLEYRQLQKKYKNQQGNFEEELSLVEKDLNRSKALLENAAISIKELEDKKREYLSAKRNFENSKIANINNKLTINNLEKNKLQLQMQSYQDKERYNQAFSQSMQALKSKIETWKQIYLLKAPMSGTVSLFNYWTKNQNLKQGDEVMSIVPIEKQEMIAKLFLPVQNSAKIKIGQTVNIKLSNYVFQEYGMLKGLVKSISVMPQNENYAIEVSLPNQLLTTYNKKLEYKQEMQGAAEIITEELSVFDRVFYQFRKIVSK